MLYILILLSGKVAGVIHDVLTTEVYSYHVPNINLIDLPGIMAAAIPGEPEDIMDQTRSLVESYLTQAHSLVLAVVAAPTRIRNSQAIQLIQKHKKQSITLGVITKPDKLFDNRNTDDPYHELKRQT